MLKRYFFSILFILLPLFIGCTEKIDLTLKVLAINSQSEPLEKAIIKINEKKVGTTDTRGVFTYKHQGDLGSSLQIEIVKESSTHYYASFFEKKLLNEKTPKNIKIKAILYQVPKPIYEDMEALSKSPDLPIEENEFKKNKGDSFINEKITSTIDYQKDKDFFIPLQEEDKKELNNFFASIFNDFKDIFEEKSLEKSFLHEKKKKKILHNLTC